MYWSLFCILEEVLNVASTPMKKPESHSLISLANSISGVAGVALIFIIGTGMMLIYGVPEFNLRGEETFVDIHVDSAWTGPSTKTIPKDEEGKLIRYGRELIIHTSKYLGPKGKIKNISNGMECTNCHLDAGTKRFGNNFSAVASTYPKFRPRYGKEESIERRINDCFERSLNGQAIDSNSHEMQAIVMYIRWLGKDVKKGVAPAGSGLPVVPYLERAADPKKGKLVYESKCGMCHGSSGGGMLKEDSSSWLNPPLWGDQSYNVGAGIYRIGSFARFVKANMPWGTTADAPQLSDEEAWDVAAYVNSLSRPQIDLSKDWPDISKKAIDHPYGPYSDSFTEVQHKFGPFKPIEEEQKRIKAAKQEKIL
jgi:thiosulfate dehydrogenase